MRCVWGQGRAMQYTVYCVLRTAYPNPHAYSAYPVWAPVYSRNTQPLCIKRRIGIRAKSVYPVRPKVRNLANTCENTQCCILLPQHFYLESNLESNFPINHQHSHTARPLAPSGGPPGFVCPFCFGPTHPSSFMTHPAYHDSP